MTNLTERKEEVIAELKLVEELSSVSLDDAISQVRSGQHDAYLLNQPDVARITDHLVYTTLPSVDDTLDALALFR